MKKNVFKYILDILLGIIIAFLLIYALRLKERYNPNLNFNLKVNSSYQELAISDEELNKIDLVSRNFVNNFKYSYYLTKYINKCIFFNIFYLYLFFIYQSYLY